jgi:hypothetical protein
MPDRSSIYNIQNPSLKYFSEPTTITDNRGTPLTNVYVSYAENPVANFYDFHGLWGSPIEDRILRIIQILRDNGFNVISIETIPLSLTAMHNIKQVNYLSVLRKSIRAGLRCCKKNDALGGLPNVANPHSMACHALLDLMTSNEDVCKYFQQIILNNAYLFPTEKLSRAKNNKSAWNRITQIPFSEIKIIDGTEYKATSKAKHLFVQPVDKNLRNMQESDDLLTLTTNVMTKISNINPGLMVDIVQGTGDEKTARNMSVFDIIKTNPNVVISEVPGADHEFKAGFSDYFNTMTNIIHKTYTEFSSKFRA